MVIFTYSFSKTLARVPGFWAMEAIAVKRIETATLRIMAGI
jgi:hypothetical protein